MRRSGVRSSCGPPESLSISAISEASSGRAVVSFGDCDRVVTRMAGPPRRPSAARSDACSDGDSLGVVLVSSGIGIRRLKRIPSALRGDWAYGKHTCSRLLKLADQIGRPFVSCSGRAALLCEVIVAVHEEPAAFIRDDLSSYDVRRVTVALAPLE